MTLWLKTLCFLIITMIFIGGYTRLTDSGLSITEWKPVTGILPPSSDSAWAQEFDKYKQSPEYIQINSGMNLQEFKSIFWIEFIHRIAGRITGLAYLLPFIYFLFKGSIRGKDIIIYSAGFILLLGQGFAGWYMVKSGLAKDPTVSHFRLALHLVLAVLLYGLLFWRLLITRHGEGAECHTTSLRGLEEAVAIPGSYDYYSKTPEIAASPSAPRNDGLSPEIAASPSAPRNDGLSPEIASSSSAPRNDGLSPEIAASPSASRHDAQLMTLLNFSLILLFLQIIFGAFVAGLDAGLVYNQFPLMGDSFIPHEITANTISLKSFSEPVFVQFIHRMIAYVLTIVIVITCWAGFKIGDKLLSKILIYLLLALIFQVGAGIITLIYAVPITIALLHQLGAVLLLSLLLWGKVIISAYNDVNIKNINK